MPEKRNRPPGGGYAYWKSRGMTVVTLYLTAEEMDLLETASLIEGRKKAGFVKHHAMEEARRVIAARDRKR